jgi:hypothetical protein
MESCLRYLHQFHLSRAKLMLVGETQMFGVTGAGLTSIRYFSNNHKRPRRGLDIWDRQSKVLASINETVADGKQ